MASVELRRAVQAGGIAVVDGSRGLLTRWFLDGLSAALAARGHPVQRERARDVSIGPDVRVVINAMSSERPISFRRRSKEIFVVGVAELPDRPDEMLQAGYALLVRSLSNVFIPIARNERGPEAYFITMEQGFHRISHDQDDTAFFEQVVERILPLAESRLVIDNEFIADLPRDLWGGDEHTQALSRAGQRLAELDLLPAPWPIDELLSPADLRHVQRLFGIGGLSYGNASARHAGDTFWMSASGVDKSHLQEIGREILLVSGYDSVRGVIRISVPPG